MNPFEPRNPNFEKYIRESFKKQSFLKLIGAELKKITPGKIEIEVKNDEKLHQQKGFFHAGVTSTIADVSMGYAALSLAPEGVEVLTTEFKINLLKPAVGEKLIARSEVIKFGKLLKVCKASVFSVSSSSEEELCAIMTGTMFVS